jgi:hypothetical protein
MAIAEVLARKKMSHLIREQDFSKHHNFSGQHMGICITSAPAALRRPARRSLSLVRLPIALLSLGDRG